MINIVDEKKKSVKISDEILAKRLTRVLFQSFSQLLPPRNNVTISVSNKINPVYRLYTGCEG